MDSKIKKKVGEVRNLLYTEMNTVKGLTVLLTKLKEKRSGENYQFDFKASDDGMPMAYFGSYSAFSLNIKIFF